jgi:hypothetical protein
VHLCNSLLQGKFEMILRRLGQALRRQDWLNVVIELLIVVVGILIAVQIGNWNQDRLNRTQVIKWRASMINDLTASRDQVGYRKIYYQQALDFAEEALVGMQSQTQVDPEQGWLIVRGAFQASQIWALQITGPTYREVMSASALNLIGSEKTLTRLTNYYDITTNDLWVISGTSPPYRDMLREKMPWLLQKYIWEIDCQGETLNQTDGGYIFTLVPCAKPALDDIILQTVEQLRSDRELQDKLRGRMSQLKVLVEVLGRDKIHITKVIESLQSEG